MSHNDPDEELLTRIDTAISHGLIDAADIDIRIPPGLLKGDVMFAFIRWEKWVGRPNSARLADAFNVETFTRTKELDQQTGRWIELRVPKSTRVWDGIDDAGHYRVNILSWNLTAGRYTVEVSQNPGASWTPRPVIAKGQYRAVNPPARGFTHTGEDRVQLEPFSVIFKSPQPGG